MALGSHRDRVNQTGKGGEDDGRGRDKETGPEKREALQRRETAAAAVGGLSGALWRGLCWARPGSGAGFPAVLHGGGAGAAGHGFPGGVCPDGRILLQGRAGGGDLPVPLVGGVRQGGTRRDGPGAGPGTGGGDPAGASDGRRGEWRAIRSIAPEAFG